MNPQVESALIADSIAAVLGFINIGLNIFFHYSSSKKSRSLELLKAELARTNKLIV